jgi:hypothetical protein
MGNSESRGRDRPIKPHEGATMAPIEKLWTVSELARATGVSASTWRRRIQAGAVTVVDIGDTTREWRVPDTVARTWLADHTIPARAR